MTDSVPLTTLLRPRTMPRAISVESDVPDGKTKQELEYTFYGQLADMSQLERAYSKERQEQWLIPLDTDVKGKMRIRRIDDKVSILTTKLKNPALKGSLETECNISNAMFEELRKFGVGGMTKTRYTFKADNSDLFWEIDVFLNTQGKPHSWVKIDLEVKSEADSFPPFPVDFLEFIVNQPSKQTQEEKDFIQSLWDKEWVSMDPAQLTIDTPPPKTPETN